MREQHSLARRLLMTVFSSWSVMSSPIFRKSAHCRNTNTHTHVQAVCLNPRMTLGICIYSESLCRLTERTEYRYDALCCGCPLYWTMAFRWGSWSFTCQERRSGHDVIGCFFFFPLSLCLWNHMFLWTHWLLELPTCRIFDSWVWFSTTRMLAWQFSAT